MIPEEEVPLIDLVDEEVPLAEEPQEEEQFDEEVPLADVPVTGDLGGLYAILTILPGSSLAWVSPRKKEEK